MDVCQFDQSSQLLAGSGPGAGDQNNPGMGGSSASDMFFDDDYDE